MGLSQVVHLLEGFDLPQEGAAAGVFSRAALHLRLGRRGRSTGCTPQGALCAGGAELRRQGRGRRGEAGGVGDGRQRQRRRGRGVVVAAGGAAAGRGIVAATRAGGHVGGVLLLLLLLAGVVVVVVVQTGGAGRQYEVVPQAQFHL